MSSIEQNGDGGEIDGYRIHARLDRGQVKLLTRTGLDWTEKYPTTAKALAAISAQQAYIDGELCALAESGVTSFGLLQAATDNRLTGSLIFFAFDLLYRDGENLLPAQLADRKERLRRLLERHEGSIRYCDHQVGLGPQFYHGACKLGLEGVVSKRLDAPYVPGNRGLWLKMKCLNREEFIVVGWTDPEGTRANLGALLLAYYDPDRRLTYAGRAGTGMSEEELVRMWRRLQPSPPVRCRLTWARRVRAASARRLSCPGCTGCGRNWLWKSITSPGHSTIYCARSPTWACVRTSRRVTCGGRFRIPGCAVDAALSVALSVRSAVRLSPSQCVDEPIP